MNCGAKVLDELFRFVVEWARTWDGMDGEEIRAGKDWFLECPEVCSGGELNMDFGRPAMGAWGGGIGEDAGDGDSEPLLKGFLRMEEPLSVLFVMMGLRRRVFKNVIVESKLHKSCFVHQAGAIWGGIKH